MQIATHFMSYCIYVEYDAPTGQIEHSRLGYSQIREESRYMH